MEAKEVLRVMPQSFIPEPAVESKVIQLNIRKEKNINEMKLRRGKILEKLNKIQNKKNMGNN